MKYLRTLICFFMLFFTVELAKAQQANPIAPINRKRIDEEFNSYVNKNQDLLLQKCGQGCLFIRFSIDEKGNIVNPQSNEGAWQFLDTFVTSALRTTNGLWPVSKGKNISVTRRTFLLPIWYSIGECKPKRNLKIMTEAEAMVAMVPVFDTATMEANAKKTAYYNFMHMTDFEKTNKAKRINSTMLDCILLAPLSITTIKF